MGKKTRRLNEIRRLVEGLPRNEVALYEDEVDIHLNPKISYAWMGYDQQKEVLTPGQNRKRYLAGTLDMRTGVVHWVEGEKEVSWLFVELLGKLYQHYSGAKKIHIVLDNYCLHVSKVVAWGLLEAKGRISLHFLPQYCPDHDKIDRVWQDLHSEVTRNHTCPDMDTLMVEVRDYLIRRAQKTLGIHAPLNILSAEVS